MLRLLSERRAKGLGDEFSVLVRASKQRIGELQMAATALSAPPSELDIFRRIVDAEQPPLSVDAAESLMRLSFSPADLRRMNQLAEKNRQGRLQPSEEEELNNFLRAGQLLGILQSKARQSLKAAGHSRSKGKA